MARDAYVRDLGGTPRKRSLVEESDIGTAAALDADEVFQVSNNLSEGVAATKRSNLGLAYGLQTIWLPAAGMTLYPSSTTGQSVYTSGGFSTTTFDFDQTTLEAVNFSIAMPKSWDKGNLFFVPYWTATGGSGAVVWTFFAAAVSDNEALDAAISTSVTSVDTFQNANRLHIGPITSGLTPDLTPANDDMIYFAMNRNPVHASDTLTSDARLIGIKLLYTISAGNDS